MFKSSSFALVAAFGLAISTASSASALTVTGTGFAIPDMSTTNTSEISISDDFIIDSMTVRLNNLKHTYASDLIATLTHVNTGTSVSLFYENGGSNDLNGNYSFNDDFTSDLRTVGVSPFPSGKYFPLKQFGAVSSLSAFEGESSAGIWKLTIKDNKGADFGSLGSWGMTAHPVPFEFSPGLGILALGACGAMAQLKSKVQKRKLSGVAFSNATLEGSQLQ